jgi:glycerol uptake facilitator protein
MSSVLLRRLLAELIGTALLVLFGAGSVVAALVVGEGKLEYAGLGMIAFSFGLIVAIVIYGFGTTSGAHINPAVTISLAAARRFPWRDVPAYVAAQLAGAVLGALLVAAMFGARAGKFGGVGLTALGPGTSYAQGVLAEALGTFILLFAIMALAIDRRAPTGWAGLIIGLSVSTQIFVLGPLTGGSINPARTFGPYVANSLIGGGTPWRQFPLYLLGPLLGGVLATLTYQAVARPVREVAEEAPQGTEGEIEGHRAPQARGPAASRRRPSGRERR